MSLPLVADVTEVEQEPGHSPLDAELPALHVGAQRFLRRRYVMLLPTDVLVALPAPTGVSMPLGNGSESLSR